MSTKKAPFFVGYLPVPRLLRRFLLGVSVLFVVVFAAVGLTFGVAQDNPGDGAFRFDYGRQTVTGVIELTPIRWCASQPEMIGSKRAQP